MAVTNSRAGPIRLVLEPWGDEILVSPGATAKVRFSGPPGGELEVEATDGEIRLYGWEGSILEFLPQ